jgi:DNA-binding NarL/FixJ family response regulator
VKANTDKQRPKPRRARDVAGQSLAHALECAREACRRGAWASAHAAFARADRKGPLAAQDLEAFATSAYMLGQDDGYLKTLERAHRAHLEAGDALRSARCAFWIGLRHALRGETARASGWFARAERLIGRQQRECVERGYLLLPAAEEQLAARDGKAAFETAAEAAAIAERFGEPDLLALARHQQGRARLQQGRVREGLALLDELMVAVTANELTPLTAGLMYCSVVEACQAVHALERARQWTSALTRWCDAQPEMLAFTGTCRLHRAELLELSGSWSEAMDEARRAYERAAEVNASAAAAALYRQAEVHRLRGEWGPAEQAYRNASEAGFDPQPGLSLLLLDQGKTQAAGRAAQRVLATTTDHFLRTRLLQACIEILLAAGEIEQARTACIELEQIAERMDSDVLQAMAAHARGAVDLAKGSAQNALLCLRRAAQLWQRMDAPYAAARARVLLGAACRELGDSAGASLEFDAAKSVFRRLGASPAVAQVETLSRQPFQERAHGLSPRELEVLRLMACGKTNKSIAAALCVSEKTVERHASNIFTRLGVPSRAAATAFAYEHRIF